MKRRTLVAALVALTGSACAAHSADGPRVGSDDPFEITVQNETGSSLRISMLDGNSETPLGRVGAMTERKLRLPGYVPPVIQLVARPSVGIFPDRAHISEPVSLQRGQQVTWQLRLSPGLAGVPRISTVKILACRNGGSC